MNDAETTNAKKPKIESNDSVLNKRVKKLEGKTFEQIILGNFKAFMAGLILGALIALYVVWDEKQERKELKKELIEYMEKTVTKVTAGK